MFNFEEKRLSEIPVVVLDTETTGLFPGIGHRLVEIAAVRLEEWKVTQQINQLIQPGRKMDPKASSVNGIYDEDLEGQPNFADISEQLLGLLEGALLVAHNATFDAGFLGMEFFICNRMNQPLHSITPLENPWLCTLQLARRHFHFGRNNLGHIARHLGIRMGIAHRALNDVYMTAEILKRMVHELDEQHLETVGDLLYAQGGAIYAPPPPQVRLPELIADALEANSKLRILYGSKIGTTEHLVTPQYPGQHQGISYLIAYCHKFKDQRTYRLDRIIRVQPIS